EAASVLLLNDEKNMLEFYAVEGEKSEALSKFTSPVEHGIAGWVIRESESIVVNDVRSDGRFFQGVDNNTGFVTNSILAVPMIAGEEKVGVVEVINKLDGEFTKDDLNLLTDIAEESAFAVKNAKMFEYVANTYCKIRSGAGSCRGCNRPLKTWTPCQRDRIIE
ncbi:MAG: GAF domain-containing protein, partial [Eubacteriales bacterium]